MGKIRENANQTTVICDAGPIIHLDELGCLDLLDDFSRVYVPETVAQEVARHRFDSFPLSLSKLEYVSAAPSVPIEIERLRKIFNLHLGEVEALSLAISSSDNIFLTDDTAARLAAKQLRIEVHGTIGIITRSIRAWTAKSRRSA